MFQSCTAKCKQSFVLVLTDHWILYRCFYIRFVERREKLWKVTSLYCNFKTVNSIYKMCLSYQERDIGTHPLKKERGYAYQELLSGKQPPHTAENQSGKTAYGYKQIHQKRHRTELTNISTWGLLPWNGRWQNNMPLGV